MLKLSDNPPVIWPEDRTIQSFEGVWWVAHTKSRNEKALAGDLVRKEVSYFLPMNWKVHTNRGRKIRSLLPIFSGYLFFCSNEKGRLEVLKTNRTASLIEVRDQQRLVKELTQLEKAIRSGAVLMPHKYIEAGEKCRVKSGALKGIEGMVVKVKNTSHLVLQVKMLGQATSVEIESDMIETVGE